MANRSKDKGARYERAAVKFFTETFPDLVDVRNPARLLGEGRKEDGGDLNVFSDVCVQVKAWNDISAGVRAAAKTVIDQADYADKTYAVGMVPIIGARAGTVAWIFCCVPGALPAETAHPKVSWSRITDMISWLRADEAPKGFLAHPRRQRIGVLEHGGSDPVWCFTSEVFADSLAAGRARLPEVVHG